MASLLEDFYAEAEEYKKKKKNQITPRQVLDGDDILIGLAIRVGTYSNDYNTNNFTTG